MVEGAVVLPMLAIFFGIMMLVHNTAITKLEIQSDTRFGAFSNAGHACVRDGLIGYADIIGIPTGPVPLEANAPDEEKDASLETFYIETWANKTKTAVALGRSQKVDAKSHLYCNPYQFGMNFWPAAIATNGAVPWGFLKMLKFAKWALKFVPLWSGGHIQ